MGDGRVGDGVAILRVAVGIAVARYPPHRSVRADFRIRLLPWMNGVKADNLLGRTSFSPWDMRYPHCVGRMRCRRSFSLVSGLPSRLSAVGCPPLFEPLIGTTPKSDSWPACLWVSRLSPFPTGLPPNGAADADQVSRF